MAGRLAERVGLTCACDAASPTGGFAAALVEQGSKAHTLSAKIQKAPNGAFHILAVERVLRGGCSTAIRSAFAVIWEIYREFVSSSSCTAHGSAALLMNSGG